MVDGGKVQRYPGHNIYLFYALNSVITNGHGSARPSTNWRHRTPDEWSIEKLIAGRRTRSHREWAPPSGDSWPRSDFCPIYNPIYHARFPFVTRQGFFLHAIILRLGYESTRFSVSSDVDLDASVWMRVPGCECRDASAGTQFTGSFHSESF